MPTQPVRGAVRADTPLRAALDRGSDFADPSSNKSSSPGSSGELLLSPCSGNWSLSPCAPKPFLGCLLYLNTLPVEIHLSFRYSGQMLFLEAFWKLHPGCCSAAPSLAPSPLCPCFLAFSLSGGLCDRSACPCLFLPLPTTCHGLLRARTDPSSLCPSGHFPALA